MLDSNGSNTTAVAAVAKIIQTVSDVRGKRVVVTAGTGPVGMRAAGLFAKAGAHVCITSRRAADGERATKEITQRFGGTVVSCELRDPANATKAMEGAEVLLNCGPAGVMIVPRSAWANRPGLRVAVDLNAVPPLGVEGIEVNDDGVGRDGVTVFGALGIGNFKMKVHKASVARLFERNDLVLDAETIAEVAQNIIGGETRRGARSA
jgi:NAD(P)-dependent dehydrogenase (short-subunit alcohol dehydrogenase family)